MVAVEHNQRRFYIWTIIIIIIQNTDRNQQNGFERWNPRSKINVSQKTSLAGQSLFKK